MQQAIIHVALVVRDYDEAIQFFCERLHFTLVEDSYQPEQDKRWVLVAPTGSNGTNLLLARASTPEQEACVGQQTGGRVLLFLRTDDFSRDYNEMRANGIKFVQYCCLWNGSGIRGLVRKPVGSHRAESVPVSLRAAQHRLKQLDPLVLHGCLNPAASWNDSLES